MKYSFQSKEKFLERLKTLSEEGVSPEELEIITPYPVEEVEEIAGHYSSGVRYFALFGALLGLLTGFLFPVFTVMDYPLISGGKPLISIPAYIIIAFELAILFGAVISFGGYLILSRQPSLKGIVREDRKKEQFVIREIPK